MIKSIAKFSLLLSSFLFICAPLAFSESTESSAKKEVEATISEVLKVVKANPGDSAAELRREKLRVVINPHFDFEEMSKRSLGTNWEGRTSEEQREFVRLFSNLLAKTYLSRIENIQEDTVSIGEEDLRFPKSVVKTTVTYKGEKFPLDYKLYSNNGQWKVYDVMIENIGLVANYRNEFASIIRKNDFVGLLNKLKEKNGEKVS